MTEQFSMQVSRALDDVGVDEETRQYRSEKYGEWNFVSSLCGHRLVYQAMLSGSKAEGTSSFEESDFDLLVIRSSVKATEREDLVQGDTDLTLFLENNTAPPGYCKLQLLQSGCWNNFWHQMFIECNCYVSCHGYIRPHLSGAAVVDMDNISMPFECKKSGPANKGQLPGIGDTDTVAAIRCAHMPLSFKDWIKSHQDNAWPTKQLMEEIAKSDIFVVPVGMHDTEHRSLQWRMSFNIPEKILIQNFTSVQYKIYVLLKMIKTEIIEPQCPESITSYIVKTLMLWAVEQIPQQIWTDRKLIDLLFHVLHMLYRCLNRGYCPMYFIPECNILHGRVTKMAQRIICDLLSSLLSNRILCILQLPRMLNKLYQYIFVPMPFRDLNRQAIEKTNIVVSTVRQVHMTGRHITDRYNLQCCVQGQARIPYEDLLTDIVSVTAPAGSDRKKLLKYVFSQTSSQLALQQCVDANSDNVSNVHNYRRLRQCVKILHGTSSTDVLCGRIRLAQVLCLIGQYAAAQDVLTKATDRIIGGLMKHSYRRTIGRGTVHPRLQTMCENACFSTSQILKKFFLSDMHYDYQMELCLPKALRYEQYRSPNERRQLHIDQETMLYLLQYVYNKQLGRGGPTNVALTNLVWCATRWESNIEYREVALNILGHCLMKEGLYDKALRVLVKSFMLVNQCHCLGLGLSDFTGLTPEAALWHIAILLYKVHRNS